jgi:hypothetical protein
MEKETRQPRRHPEGDRIVEIEEAPLPFLVLACVFSGLIVASAAVGSKVVDVFGLTPSATVLAYSLSFLCTDVVSEVYGRERSKQLVSAGVVVYLLCIVVFQLAIYWPAASFWNNQEAYASVLGTSTRIFIAGVIGYILSQYHDVWAFHFWRKVTKGKHLWLRNNASTMASHLIGTVIFITIVFWGGPVIKIIIGQYIVKLVIALFDTPFAYLLVNQIRKRASYV